MTKQEFLDELQNALQGKIKQGQVNKHLHYYENYIMEEARKGSSESQVIEALGSPRLIAKTLVDTTDKFSANAEESYYEKSTDRHGRFQINSWYGKLALIAIFLLILFIIVRLVSFVLPILIPVFLFLIIRSIILGGRRR
jgi:uncharacterized membrane protein